MTQSSTDEKTTGEDRERERVLRPNFISEIVERDLAARRVSQVVTRFPPEPNGYLHIGHVMAICLDFGLADDYGGKTNLRFDDTNPTTEDVEYAEAIKGDVRWLGFEWEDVFHASDYFDRLYDYARQLIRDGKAYVDSLTEEQIREYRGTITEPGRESPYRNRPAEESLDLLERMRRGEFPEGAHVLRAKIDMASRNMKMRDPLLYRIRHASHWRTGEEWHIYPMYDFAHPLSDAIEGVTHSLCTLEFENNRELYDWVVENTVGEPRPRQYEFAGLVLEYTVLSKRRLVELVRRGIVEGWDDPRMPTIAGVRRRGVTADALRDLVNRVGVTRSDRRSDYALLEHSIRDDLNTKAPRVMAIQEPLKVVITTLGEDETVTLDAPYWPQDVPGEGTRPLTFAREIFVERGDFSKDPPKGWRRLAPGWEVRLRHGFVVRCDEVVEDEDGRVVELRCSHDPDTLGRNPEGRKVRGTIHWLSRRDAVPAKLRLYDRLFTVPNPLAGEGNFFDHLNPDSLLERDGLVERSVLGDPEDTRYQFERLGYFWQDPVESQRDALVFNRIVTLKDSWSKARQAAAGVGTDDGSEQAEARRGRARQPARARGAGRRSETGAAAGRQDGTEPEPEARLTQVQVERMERYRDELGVEERSAVVLAGRDDLARFFEETLRHHDDPRTVANWLVNELLRELKDKPLASLPVTPAGLGELLSLVDSGAISTRSGKEVFEVMLRDGGAPAEIVEARGLRQMSDEGAIAEIVERLAGENPDKVEAYRGGKTGLSGFFVGQVMRETGGTANPQLVKELVERKLSESN